MNPTVDSMPLMALLAFLVAVLYSMVGHGGASGYLAFLTLLSFPREPMAVTALTLNLVVSATAFFAFLRQGHFSARLTWPYVTASIPAAFLGGCLRVSAGLYFSLLALVLGFAACRLLVVRPEDNTGRYDRALPISACALIGAAIGIVSGIVGVGGGIFLSPILLLFGLADAKKTAATSAGFIFANSYAGLLGRWVREKGMAPWIQGSEWFLAAALIGGMLGSRMGAVHFSNVSLRRILAFLLAAASFKLAGSAIIS